MKVTGGDEENGIVVGNTFDKYNSSNPLVNIIMRGFESSLSQLVSQTTPLSIHEVGCGEGYWTIHWAKKGAKVKGSDFSNKVIEIARQNAISQSVDPDVFFCESIYQLKAEFHSADLIVCCEVLEHLDDPEAALAVLQKLTKKNIILSVPREPVWRVLNLARGKYIKDFGNTPGHLQHWSSSSFMALVSQFFRIVAVKKPLPWTMLLCEPIKMNKP
jgi:2-polyprenyl-3-methyl-5-hydroxy-6-metoxy-1,4-benzoquinol methylase